MRVLIVSTNRCRDPAPVLPLGACAVAEAAETAGHRVRLLDLMFERRPFDALSLELAAYDPEVVGLSIRNLDNTTMEAPESFVPEVLSLLRLIRRCSRAEVVLGGAAVGVAPRALLEATGGSWAVPGEGETTFPLLLEALSGGAPPGAVPGVLSASGAPAESPSAGTAPRPVRWSFPDLDRWLNLGRYRGAGGSVPLQTKRGCPLACIYCPCPKVEGANYRLCPPDEAAEELSRLRRSGIREVEIVDSVFNAPQEHAYGFCDAVSRKDLRLRLHSFELNPGFLDGALLNVMERAGFAGIGITAESASSKVLARLGKNYGADELWRAAGELRRRRIPCLWLFMLGGPGETEETVAETLRFASRAIAPTDVAFFSVGIRIFPGTKLEEIAKR
ncbi:MAG: radical SAM protein, partial [Deltaproteobacteria bacterium]|nr:radical SAM protein [Deltaproteobacteria bacterium]